MKGIHMNEWDRREHFEFFSHSDLPFYNVTFNVDITGLAERARDARVPFTTMMIYLSMKALHRVRNFLYRLEDGMVLEYDRLDPWFTCIRDGEELFRFVTVEYVDDLAAFAGAVRSAIETSERYFDLGPLMKRSNFVFISPMPWISFTAIDHTMSLRKEDAMPRITWGRYYRSEGRTVLPYNIQVNHMFIDGIHVGRFHDALNEEIRDQTR